RAFGVLLLSPSLGPGDDHAGRAARAASALLQRAAEQDLPLAVALHSGPLLAGVIGEAGVRYEAWGEGPDTAEALTVHAAAGAALVSPTTYALLRDRFVFDVKGVAEVAGRGQMKLYRLAGELDVTVASS